MAARSCCERVGAEADAEHGTEEERISELSPLAPCTDGGARASGASSATSRRIAFVPVRESVEVSAADLEAVEEGGGGSAKDERSVEPTHASDAPHHGDAPPEAPTHPAT